MGTAPLPCSCPSPAGNSSPLHGPLREQLEAVRGHPGCACRWGRVWAGAPASAGEEAGDGGLAPWSWEGRLPTHALGPRPQRRLTGVPPGAGWALALPFYSVTIKPPTCLQCTLLPAHCHMGTGGSGEALSGHTSPALAPGTPVTLATCSHQEMPLHLIGPPVLPSSPGLAQPLPGTAFTSAPLVPTPRALTALPH